MVKYCPKCGNTIEENARFCPKCGEQIPTQNQTPQNFEQQTSNIPQQQTPPPPQPTQQPYQQPPPAYTPPPQQPMQQQYTGYPPKKSHKKLIVGIITLVLIIGGALAVYFFVFANDEAKFVGKWEVTKTSVSYSGSGVSQVPSLNDYTDNNPSESEIEFKSDGSWESQNQSGSWEIEDGKLIMNYDSNSMMSSYMSDLEFDYSFDGDDLTLTYTVDLEELYGDSIPDGYGWITVIFR